jgi:hypothetical protein
MRKTTHFQTLAFLKKKMPIVFSGGFRGGPFSPEIYHQMLVILKIWDPKYVHFFPFWGMPPPLFKISGSPTGIGWYQRGYGKATIQEILVHLVNYMCSIFSSLFIMKDQIISMINNLISCRNSSYLPRIDVRVLAWSLKIAQEKSLIKCQN